MKKILNIGCGNDTYGTHFIDKFPQRKEVLSCSIDEETIPFPDNYFDEVYSRCVLEHLQNIGFAIKEMARVLKRNGRIELETDNASFWIFAFDNQAHTTGYRGKGNKVGEDTHFSLFTDWHLKNFFEKNDLVITGLFYLENYNANTWKRKTIKVINKIIVKIKPIRRMGYYRLKIKGIKK
jgi:ubiquinone/menaquinone biosynthesis C-methylase UbiE